MRNDLKILVVLALHGFCQEHQRQVMAPCGVSPTTWASPEPAPSHSHTQQEIIWVKSLLETSKANADAMPYGISDLCDWQGHAVCDRQVCCVRIWAPHDSLQALPDTMGWL